MCVVVNMGSHWRIPINDDVEPQAHPEQQLWPRGRRNVQGRGERGQPMHHNAPIGATFGRDVMPG